MSLVIPLALGLSLGGPPAQALDARELEAFVDGVVMTAMEDHRIPGVVVSVVQNGEVLLEKGYGYSRENDRVRVDPTSSLFRIASISKIFNAIALMQLVEEGRVDLDADFTTYLPGIRFELPMGTVRVRDLLTHSAGFEDGYLGHFWAVDEASDRTLEETVRRFQPRQVRAPGERVVYSNYGTSVIGLIIERQYERPYAEVMQERLFKPLGMDRSAFRDWGTAREEPDLAWSHTFGNGAYNHPSWAWMHRGWMPAGGVVTTASDMSRFMLAQLAADESLLRQETWARMQRPLIANHPFVTPNAHGYWANEFWGYPTLQHGGSIFGFMSNMVLVPELGLGIFISTNTPTGIRLSSTLPRRLIGRFYPSRITIPRVDPEVDLSEYRGKYRGQRRAYSTVEKASHLFGTPVQVRANSQGYLVVTGGGMTGRFVPLGPDRFINADTGERIAFSRDANDRPFLLHNDYGHNNFERITFIDGPWPAYIIAGLLGLAFLVRLGAIWYYRKETFTETEPETLARWTTLIIIPIWVLTVSAMFRDFAGSDYLTSAHMAHYPTTWGWVWIGSGLLGALIMVPMLIYLVPMWWKGKWPRNFKIAYSGYIVLLLAFLALLHHWNLLGLRVLG